MSHRRPDPGQAMLELTLRSALRLAADSIEPAGDGLERIRRKIATGPPPPFLATGWAAWRARYLSGLLAVLMTAAWYLEPIGKRVWYAFAEVAERFRPDADDTRKLRWLRPAAALTAAFLVVASLSFAVTTVPPAIIQAASNGSPDTGGGHGTGGPSSGNSGSASGRGGRLGQSGNASPQGSPSCKAGGSSASASASPSPSPSPGSSSAGSPSPSPSPSPTSTPTETTSPTPTESPSPTGSASGQATQPPDSPPGPAGSQPVSAGAIPVPGNATPKSSPPHPTSGSKGPCRA